MGRADRSGELLGAMKHGDILHHASGAFLDLNQKIPEKHN